MTVANLKKILADMDDSARVVVPAADHSYRECRPSPGTAIYDKSSGMWSEDHGEGLLDSERRVIVLILS